MAMKDYYAALERLKNNKPLVLTRGKYSINNDSVAEEAGRQRGAIKNLRHGDLITAIKEAEKDHKPISASSGTKKDDSLDKKYQASLNRELMLLDEIKRLEERVRELESENVVEFPLKSNHRA
jgi:hypothetical protein